MTRDTASRDELLHKLHDGELPAEEAEALRAELSAEEEQQLLGLGDLGALVRNSVSAEVDEQPPELWTDLWAGIEQKLDPPQAPAQAAPAEGKVLPLRRRMMVRITAAVSAAAVAASLLLWVRPLPVSNRCDVEELEVAGSNAMVLTVPDDRGDTTTLIWFEHQQEDEWESL
jgi:hypothetical protein